jgi:hypothetical protein
MYLTTKNTATFVGEEIDFNGGVTTRVENLAVNDMLSRAVQDGRDIPGERGF